MYSKKYIETKVLEHFSNREAFSRDELFRVYRMYEPDANDSTLAWRLFDLKKKHRIKNVAKGFYTLDQKKVFKPQVDEIINKIADLINRSGSVDSYNIWTTAWLNAFTELQATSLLYVVEVERSSVDRIFYLLKDIDPLPHVYNNPDGKLIVHYVSEAATAIVVMPMISRAPTLKIKDIVFPSLEKILVDLFCEKRLFLAYQGKQLVDIFDAALSTYVINYSRLLNYAKRRHRDEDLKAFLYKHRHLYPEILSLIT